MLVINGVLIVMLFSGRDKSQRPFERKGGFMEKVSNDLGLEEEQKTAYFEMAKAHRLRMRNIHARHRELMQSYFQYLKDPEINEEKIANTLEALVVLEEEKLLATYAHFNDLRGICTEEQKERFELIIDDLIKIFSGRKRMMQGGSHSNSHKH